MKTLKAIIFLIIVAVGFIKAQVDTTDWFPTQAGNYWEYMAWTGEGPKYFSIKILGDTLMPNGKEYKIFYKKYFDLGLEGIWFDRKQDSYVYRYFGDSISCETLEYKFLDFTCPDSTVWLICAPLFYPQSGRGISFTYLDYTYYTFLQKPTEAKVFEDVQIDSVDTLWTPNDGSFPILLNKGLGIVWHFIFNDGSYYLQGAIINGITMGTIVGVEKEDNTIPNNFSLRAYPNPFNPSTSIRFEIPEFSVVSIKVFNVLGKEIKLLLEENLPAGEHNFQWNGKDNEGNTLPSGIYFIQMKANEYQQTIKSVLLK